MRSAVIALLLCVAYCEARPRFLVDAEPTFGSGSAFIIGGVPADLGEFPWQYSLQRNRGSSWSHSCGGSLLSEGYALTAAHCVDGSSATVLRVVAGVVVSSSTEGAISGVTSYKKHEQYNTRRVLYSDDIAILTLASPIQANGVTIQYAKLPNNGDDLFVGGQGIITGWGRIDAGNVLPLVLQKAPIGAIGTAVCNGMLAQLGNSAYRVDDTQICLYDAAEQTTACNGDSGGPFNLNNGAEQSIVAGVCSWSPKIAGVCLTYMPSMYTRTSAYLDWIKTNTQ